MGNVLWCVGRPFFPHRILVGRVLLVTIARQAISELAWLQQVTTMAQALFLFLLGVLLTEGWSCWNNRSMPGFVWRCGFAGLAPCGWSRHDIARRTVTQVGLTRFMAICLLSGYGMSGWG